jgi:hypothetical protein
MLPKTPMLHSIIHYTWNNLYEKLDEQYNENDARYPIQIEYGESKTLIKYFPAKVIIRLIGNTGVIFIIVAHQTKVCGYRNTRKQLF